MQLTSSSFRHGEVIPVRHTGEGVDLSPPLRWTDPPAGTVELALIVEDPDAPTPEPWVHWLVYGLPPGTRALHEGVPRDPSLEGGGYQGVNSWETDNLGYRGPMPPPGHGVHHYHFWLFALDAPVGLRASATKRELLGAMHEHVLDKTELIGTYER